ncbi:hypothetical protein [Chryseobacterium sp. RLHN22]|uniref:hypothetical protein n=1 Tax=Chryseobacterium sp. RLHN22 TaxID=3437885 RepID=UPI003D9BF46C
MKKTFILLPLFLTAHIFAQQNDNRNNFMLLKQAVGDLNRDGLQDKIILSEDTTHSSRPLRLQIFFLGSDRKFKSAFSSTEVFEFNHSDGISTDRAVPDIRVENNNLVISKDINSEKQEQTFRHNKGKFELVSVSKIKSDENTTVETKTDLIAGTVTETTKTKGSKKSKKNQKKITVNILPTLDNIKSFSHEFN